MKKKRVAILLFFLFYISCNYCFAQVQVGDVIEYGHYEQNMNPYDGSEPIEWQVLMVDNGYALLISKYGLDAKPYNESLRGVTWETSTLRNWLNKDFINNAFTSEEKSRIGLATVNTPDNPEYGTSGGNATKDYIFLLSVGEANQLFIGDAARKCTPTNYVKSIGGQVSTDSGTSFWWLRTPGKSEFSETVVLPDGSFWTFGNTVATVVGIIRPVFWLKI